MAYQGSIVAFPEIWVPLSGGAMTKLSVAVEGGNDVFLLATVDGTAPTSPAGRVEVKAQDAIRGQLVADLWPGIAGTQVWAMADGGLPSRIQVSHDGTAPPAQAAPEPTLDISPTTAQIGATVNITMGGSLGVPPGTATFFAAVDGTPVSLSGTGAARTFVATFPGQVDARVRILNGFGSVDATARGYVSDTALLTLPVAFTVSAAGPAGVARFTVSGPIDPAADRIVYRTTDGIDRTLITKDSGWPATPFSVDTTEAFVGGVTESAQAFFARGADLGPLGTAQSVTPNAAPSITTPPSLTSSWIGGDGITFVAGVATGIPLPSGASFPQFMQRQGGPTGTIETLSGITGHLGVPGYRYRTRATPATVAGSVNYTSPWGGYVIPQALAAGDWTVTPGTAPGTYDVTVSNPMPGILDDLVVSTDGGPPVSIDTAEPWSGTTTAAAGSRSVRVAFRNTGTLSDGSNIQWSDTKTVTVASGAVATKPAPFTDLNVEITPVGNGLSFDIGSLPSDGGSPLIRIDYRIRAAGTSTWGAYQPLDSTAPFTGQTDVAGISPADYEVQLFAVNAVGRADEGFTETVSVTAFYPAVPAVDLSATPSSIQFPEFNGRALSAAATPVSTTILGNPRAALLQPLNFALPASTGEMQVIVVASDPPENWPSTNTTARGLFGNASRTQNQASINAQTTDLCLYLSGRTLRVKCPQATSASTPLATTAGIENTPADFIAAATFSAGTVKVSHSEILTGLSQVSQPLTATFSSIASGANFNIGVGGRIVDESVAAGPAMNTAFTGRIQAVYVLVGASIAQTVIDAIARGEITPQSALPIANVRLAREASNGQLVKPSWATADTTVATVKLGATPLVPGKTILPQSATNYLLPRNSHDNRIYGLLPNERVTEVPFEARAPGPVDVRVFDETGAIVRDWTQLSAYDATSKIASGTVSLPIGTAGMYRSEYRLRAAPTVRALDTRFGVGFIATGEGQSQMWFAMQGAMRDVPLDPNARVLTGENGITANGQIASVGGWERLDFPVGFANMWTRLMGKVPVMLISSAVTGTGHAELLYDDDTYLNTIYVPSTFRKWAPVQERINAFGPKYTAIFETWLTNDKNATTEGADWKARKAALYYGDQPSAMPPIQHSYATSLTPGYGVIHMPVTRGASQGGAGKIGEYEYLLAPFALSKGQTMALPAPDMQMGANGKDSGHAKGGRPGPRHFGRAVAVGLGRLIGVPTVSNPYWTNPRKTARNVIAVDLVQGAGGTISISSDPLAKHPWCWSTTGGDAEKWTFNDPDIALAVTNAGMTLTLTKTNGDWPDTVYLSCRPGGASNIYQYTGTNDDFATFEDQAVLGLPRETWADDPLGDGIPIVGSVNTDGKWWPIFETVLGPYVPPTVFATAASVESYVTTMAGRKSTAPLIPLNPEQLTGRPTGLTFADGFFTLGGSATGWIENFEFGAKIRLNNAAATGFLGFRNCVFKTTRGGGVQNTEIINAASTFRLPSVEDCLFLNENNVLGQGMAINVGRPADGSPLSIQRNRFRGFTSDVLQVPVHTIKHNWFDYTHTIPVANPAAWNATTTYAQYDLVTNNGWVFMSEVDGNVGNAPPTTETGSTSFWRPKNPHLDAISARGTIAGGEGIVQNFIDMRGDGSGVLKGINNYVRHYGLNAASYVAGPLLIKENSLRRTGADGACFGWEGDTLTDPAYATIDGNWIDPNQAGSFGPSLSTALGQERVKWGTNRNPTSNAVLTRPANAGAL